MMRLRPDGMRCSVSTRCLLLLLILTTNVVWAAVPPAPISVSASGPIWANLYFPTPQTGSFTAQIDAVPLASGVDAGIGLSSGPQSAFTGLACIGRFNTSGSIDARNGGSYAAVSSVPYVANQTYHFRFVVTLSSHTYSLYVAKAGQAEQTVALNYAFRTEQKSVANLNNWSMFADTGSMRASNFLAASTTSTANSVWTNSPFLTQSGSFQAEWDALSTLAGIDGVVALSNGAQTSYTGFACLVRFSTDNTIQVRNGGVFTADTTLFYTANVMYHFRVAVNIASHTYSVYVTPSGGTEQLIANNYAFRTEQGGVTSLSNAGSIVDSTTGSLLWGNFVINVASSPSAYNQTILADSPVAFWNIAGTGSTEPDLSGRGNTGRYNGGSPGLSTMPNGDQVAVFNGSSQYLSVPSNASFSIPTTGNLTWEIWVKPSVLQFPNASDDGYVDVMGKCYQYSPTCEWESRMYSTTTPEGRPNRMSAYVFNPGGGLGSAADWQPVNNLIQANHWYHIVGEYTTQSTPSGCNTSYPGGINIWVNGVLWNMADHFDTGCMSQYSIVPHANNSPLNIGTMALDTWFPGAIGKVAIYNYLLTPTQITNHYKTMTGQQPTGSCGNTCSF